MMIDIIVVIMFSYKKISNMKNKVNIIKKDKIIFVCWNNEKIIYVKTNLKQFSSNAI